MLRKPSHAAAAMSTRASTCPQAVPMSTDRFGVLSIQIPANRPTAIAGRPPERDEDAHLQGRGIQEEGRYQRHREEVYLEAGVRERLACPEIEESLLPPEARWSEAQ